MFNTILQIHASLTVTLMRLNQCFLYTFECYMFNTILQIPASLPVTLNSTVNRIFVCHAKTQAIQITPVRGQTGTWLISLVYRLLINRVSHD